MTGRSRSSTDWLAVGAGPSPSGTDLHSKATGRAFTRGGLTAIEGALSRCARSRLADIDADLRRRESSVRAIPGGQTGTNFSARSRHWSAMFASRDREHPEWWTARDRMKRCSGARFHDNRLAVDGRDPSVGRGNHQRSQRIVFERIFLSRGFEVQLETPALSSG